LCTEKTLQWGRRTCCRISQAAPLR
jgi:hypothetical protein